MDQNKYLEIISHAKGETEDIAFELFELISKEKSSKDQIAAFAFACEATLTIRSDESRELAKHFTDDRLEELQNTHGPFVDVTLDYVTQKAYREHLTQENFYELLWNLIFNSDSLKDYDEKAFALYWILADKQIPFVSLPAPISIEMDEIRSFLENNVLLFHSMRYIIGLPIAKRATVASLLLQKIESLQSEKDKTILLTCILAEIDKNYRKTDK